MKTTAKEYRYLIEYRVNALREYTGTPYQVNYCPMYGGWNLYYVKDGETGHTRGKFGFDIRKSNTEMLNYLNGILDVFNYYNVTEK